MTDRFEDFVQSHNEQKMSAEAMKLRRVAEEARIIIARKELYDSRIQLHNGDSPEDLWGVEAGKMCNEFLEFARKRSIGRQILIGSPLLIEPSTTEKYHVGTTGFFTKIPNYKKTRSKSCVAN